MSDYDSRIKDLKRRQLELKISSLKTKRDDVEITVIDAESIEDFELIDLKMARIELMILERKKELENMEVNN